MPPLACPLAQVRALKTLVEDGLQQVLPDAGDPPHRVHAAMRYAVLGPGKRLRPLLALISAQHLGCPAETVLPAACALELVHAASLVLDDLPCMDDSPMRRGQPSVHVRYGEEIAVLTGVALLNEAYGLVCRAPHIPPATRVALMELLVRTVGPSGLVGGQDKDLSGGQLSASAASQLHHEKTGVLFLAAVEIGGRTAGADEPSLEALRNFALELGLAFQAMDDLSDAEDLTRSRPSFNMAAVLGGEGLRREAGQRLRRAKAALQDGPAPLAPMGDYLDLLLGRVAA